MAGRKTQQPPVTSDRYQQMLTQMMQHYIGAPSVSRSPNLMNTNLMNNGPGGIVHLPNQGSGLPRTNSLRKRMYGDPVGEFMESHAGELRQVIQEDSEHQRVHVRHGWHTAQDAYVVTVVCNACERKWTARMPAEGMTRDISANQWEREFVSDVLAPLVEKVTKDACFGAKEAAVLSEWCTARLAAAGPRGMPYVQVVHEAVAHSLCTPADVDATLRTLKFVSEWVTLANSGLILPGGWDGEWTLPILHLPKDHPMRTW